MIKRKLFLAYQNIKWLVQIAQRGSPKCKAEAFKNIGENRCFFIVPHADDELFGGFEFLKKNVDNVVLFYCGFLGSNYSKENMKIRKNEFVEICNKNGFSYILSGRDIENDLCDALKKYKPDSIFTPSIVDWHDEHRLVSDILYNNQATILDSANFFWYQISVPISYKYVNKYVTLTKKQLICKWLNFNKVYNSQAMMPIRRFDIESKYDGKITNSYAAEVFVELNREDWLKLIIKSHRINEEYEQLKSNINNLYSIYKQSVLIYDKLFQN